MPSLKDKVGEIHNGRTIIREDLSRNCHKTHWVVQCNVCKTRITVRDDNLHQNCSACKKKARIDRELQG